MQLSPGTLSEEGAVAGAKVRAIMAAGSGRRLLLNFGNVERLSSAVLGQVVALGRAVRRDGGRLALCGLRPDLSQLSAGAQNRFFRTFDEQVPMPWSPA